MKKSLLQKVVSITLGVATILWSFGVPLGILFAPGQALAAASSITEAAVPSEVLASANTYAAAGAVVAADKISLVQASGSATLAAVTVVITDPSTTGLLNTDIASVSLRKESGATAGFQTSEDTLVAGATQANPAIGSGVTLTPTTPETIGTTAVDYYIVVTIASSPGTGRNLAVSLPVNYGTDDNLDTVGTALTATKKITIDVAPTVTSVSAFTDRIIVNLSEQVDGMQAMNCANYVVNASALTCGGPGLPFADFQGNKITIRGLTLSGTVAFSIPSTNTIVDISGGSNSLTAYSDASVSVGALSLPTITSITPSSGAVGATLTIAGSNFGANPDPGGTNTDANHRVLFSGGFSTSTGPLPPVEATSYTSWSATSIQVVVPTGANGGPVSVLVDGVVSDMGPNSFFDIAADYTARVYYSADTSTPMPDGDSGNIRIIVAGMSGPVVRYVGDGAMTYNAGTDTFTITGVSSMGWTWAYDITGAHLSSPGTEVDTSATQEIHLLSTTRSISGTLTLGTSCTSAGQDKNVVVFAMPDVVDSGDAGFKEVEPTFFTTGPTNGQTACQTTYSVGVPINGTYRVEAHMPPEMSGSSVVSSSFTDPDSQTATITDAALTATGKNFTFTTATHRIVGSVEKPASASFGTEERDMLWVFAYQPKAGGKGTATQVANDGTFTLNVSKGIWKVGVEGPNMPFPVEAQVDVDDTYLIGQPAKGPTLVIAPPADFIEGYAKDSAGNGLANVSLYAWLEGGPGGGHANTDSQGYYKMYVTPGSNYHVGAHSQTYGFLGEQSGITVSSSVHPTVNFTVSSTDNYTISGTVTKGGVGLQQAFVFITNGEKGPMLGGGGTDSSGAYTVRVSGGTSRWIHVGLPGKGEVYKENLGTISANNTSKNIAITSSTIRVRISPTASLTQAFVGAHSTQGGGFSETDVTAGALSYREYQIDIPRPTSGSVIYYVDGGVPGYGPLSKVEVVVDSSGNFTETSGTTDDGIVEYTLSLSTVSGTVAGTNPEGAWVWSASPTGGGGGAQVASDGTYSFKLKDGTYDLGVGKPGYIGNKITITVAGSALPNQDLTLTASDQTIAGKVYLPDGTTTVTNAWVWAGNSTGGWAGGSTNANGDYTLNVGSGSWKIQAAYDGYESAITTSTAPAAGVNITLSAISGFASNLKNTPVTPSEGGIVQGTGVKVDFPKNSLGTGSTAGTVEVKSTTNVPTVSSTKIIGTAKDITARNSSNQTITTLSGSIAIELTASRAEIEAQGLTFAQVQNMKISYWDSTANNWVEISTVVTLHPSTATTIAGLDADPAVTLSGTVGHLSAFALTVPTDEALSTPSGLSATATSSSTVNLSWTAVTGAVGYDVYRGVSSNASFPRLGTEPTVSGNSTVTYADTGLSAGSVYYYKISAVSASGESAASSSVSATTLGAPTAGGSGGGGPAAFTPTPTPGTEAAAPSSTELQLVPVPSVPANPAATDIQAAIDAILQNISLLRAQLAEISPQEAAQIPGKPAVCQGITFSRGLTPNIVGNDVKCLQAFLNQSGDTALAGIGPGSKDLETNFFGQLTATAVEKFQLKYGVVADESDPGYGYVGPKTRAKINSLLGQ